MDTDGDPQPDPGGLALIVEVAADDTEIVARGEYCPAPAPCPGRPAVRFVTPVRLQSDPGTVVGQVRGVYCPHCKSNRPDTVRR